MMFAAFASIVVVLAVVVLFAASRIRGDGAK